MKKVFSVLAVLAMLLAPAVGHATAIKGADEFTLRKGETISNDLYTGSRNVIIAGDIVGDLVAGGGTVLVSGMVSQDVLAAGGNINISGVVRDDVRVAGGTVLVQGTISDDLVIAGGQVTLVSGSSVGGDLLAAGGMVSVGGVVNGDVRIAGGQVVIRDVVKGNVHILADNVTIAKTAVINGSLTYRSANEAQIEPGAQIKGEVDFQKATRVRPFSGPAKGIGVGLLAGLWSIAHITKFLSLLVLALLFIVVYGRIAETIVTKGVRSFWKNLGLGFLALIMTPITAIILFVTIVGMPLGFVLLLGYIVWLILAWVISPVIFGSIVYRAVTKRATPEVHWKSVLVGCVSLFVIGLIPVVGWLIQFGVMLVAMGVLLKMKYEYLIAHR